MNIKLLIDGENYTYFKSFFHKRDIDALCSECNIVANAIEDKETGEPNNFPIRVGSNVVITCDDEPILTGYVCDVEGGAGEKNHDIIYSVKDKTVDLEESKLESKEFKGVITFENLLKKVFDHCNIEYANPLYGNFYSAKGGFSNKIGIINNFGDIAKFKASDKIQVRSSENAYNFINRYADKRQMVVNTDGNGNLVLNKIGNQKAFTLLKNIKNNKQNNIKTSSFKANMSGRYNKYIVRAEYVVSRGQTASSVGIAYDEEVRKSRVITILSSSPLTNAECKKRAEWEANVRKGHAFYYTCEVFGFRQKAEDVFGLDFASNPLWDINQSVYVIDDFWGIDDEMLVKGVERSQSKEGGTTTTLTLVSKINYQQTLDEPFLRKKKEKKPKTAGFLF